MSNIDLSFTDELKTNPNAGYSEGFNNAPLPPGAYSLVIEKAVEVACCGGTASLNPEKVQKHIAETGADPGRVINITAKVVEGPHAGRKVFWGKTDFMLVAPSDEPTREGVSNGKPWKISPAGSVKSSKENLDGLLRTCGHGPISEVRDLIGLAGVFTCKVSKDGKYNKWYFKPQKDGVRKVENVGTTPVAPKDDEPPF